MTDVWLSFRHCKSRRNSVNLKLLEPHELDEDVGFAGLGPAAVSPNGSNIAYLKVQGEYGTREIWLMGQEGQSRQRLLMAPNQSDFLPLGWAPTGDWIA